MKFRKLSALLLAVLLVVAPFTNVFAGEVEPAKTDDIVVFYTNDVHNETANYAKIATLKKEAAAANAAAFLVDAGDYAQGGQLGTLTKGEALIEIMNEAGYDYAAIGNHEFDYGMDRFLYLANDVAEFDILSSNFVTLADGKAVVKASAIETVGETKIAFVGVSTPETLTKSTPTYFQDAEGNWKYGFCNDTIAEVVQAEVDKVKADGADVVILLAHLGIDEQSAPWRSTDIIPEITSVDVVLDGHSHSKIVGDKVADKEGNEVILTSTGTKTENVGKLVIASDGTITTELIAQEDMPEADAEVQAVIDAENKEFEALLNQVVARTEVDLIADVNKERPVRKEETNLGDLCADAYRVLLDADVAFVNGGGVRADIPKGDITYGQIINVHPFGNSACTIEATGEKIYQALEMGASIYPEKNGGFLQVSGVKFDLDPTVDSGVVLDGDGMFVELNYAEGADTRIKNVQILNKTTGEYEPIDLEKTYILASHNFMLKSAGDGFAMFKGTKVLQDEVLIDNQVLINYIVEELGGVVGEEYAKPQGRINILPDVTRLFDTEETVEITTGKDTITVPVKVHAGTEDEVAVAGLSYVVATEDTFETIATGVITDMADPKVTFEVENEAEGKISYAIAVVAVDAEGNELTEVPAVIIIEATVVKSNPPTGDSALAGMAFAMAVCAAVVVDKKRKAA